MIKKLTRTSNGIAVVLDKHLLEELGLDEGAEVEVSTNGQIIVITRNAMPRAIASFGMPRRRSTVSMPVFSNDSAIDEPAFLTLDEVLSIHAEQNRLFGGSSGIRDVGPLESAMGSFEATLDGVFLHETSMPRKMRSTIL
jgi:hypothetical protein